MKHHLLPIAVLFILGLVTLAGAQPDDRPPYVIGELAVTTDYMWRGFSNLDGRPAFQPWAYGRIGETGFSAVVWGSWSLTHRDLDWIQEWDEFDVIVSWYQEFEKSALEVGYFHANWFQRENWPRESYTVAREVFAGLTLTTLPLTPIIRINYEVDKFDGNDLYLEADLHYTHMAGTQPLDMRLHGGYMEADWAPVKNVTDVTFEVTAPVPGEGGLTYVPRVALTWIPDRAVNSSEFEAWAGFGLQWAY